MIQVAEHCIRGIPNNTFVNSDGSIGTHLFYFKPIDGGGWLPQSISWEDDDTVLARTLNQRRADGELQFQGGATRISTLHIDHICDLPQSGGHFTYEREPLPENRYHGNLLLHPTTQTPIMKQIAASLALAARYLPLPPDSQTQG